MEALDRFVGSAGKRIPFFGGALPLVSESQFHLQPDRVEDEGWKDRRRPALADTRIAALGLRDGAVGAQESGEAFLSLQDAQARRAIGNRGSTLYASSPFSLSVGVYINCLPFPHLLPISFFFVL